MMMNSNHLPISDVFTTSQVIQVRQGVVSFHALCQSTHNMYSNLTGSWHFFHPHSAFLSITVSFSAGTEIQAQGPRGEH